MTPTIYRLTQVKGYTRQRQQVHCLCFSCFSEDEIKKHLEKVEKEYTRHHCYAYTLHPDKSLWRANDDGEPANTAGKPILGQIQSKDLTNILIVVVRYFGGVKLGVGGLITAYKTAAGEALTNMTFEKRFVKEVYVVSFRYAQMNDVMRIVKEKALEVINQDFQIECKLVFAIRKSKAKLVTDSFSKKHELKIVYQKTI